MRFLALSELRFAYFSKANNLLGNRKNLCDNPKQANDKLPWVLPRREKNMQKK